MYKIFILVFLFISNITLAQTYHSRNITKVGHWDGAGASAGWVGNRYAGCYGYEQAGRQYAIIGAADGNYAIDITIPASPVLIDNVPGAFGSCTWREIHTYSHYVYLVSDDVAGSPNHLQIWDLQYLPDSVHVVHNSNSIIEQAHTIYVDNNLLYTAVSHSPSFNAIMAVFDLTNPENPSLLRRLDDDYPGIVGHVHDMLVHNDTVYASCGDDGLFIFKYNTISNNFTLLGSITTYPYKGYAHNSALMPDGVTLISTDEVPGSLDVKSFDVSDPTDIQVNCTFHSDYQATPHNAYNAGINNRTILSYYQDGVWVFDATKPDSVYATGYFDTHYQSIDAAHETDSDYKGNWGAYIFPSNHRIIASDMQNGLYILNADTALGLFAPVPIGIEENIISLEANLHNNTLFFNNTNNPIHVSIFDMQGHMLWEANNINTSSMDLPYSSFTKGLYAIEVNVKDQRKLIKWLVE